MRTWSHLTGNRSIILQDGWCRKDLHPAAVKLLARKPRPQRCGYFSNAVARLCQTVYTWIIKSRSVPWRKRHSSSRENFSLLLYKSVSRTWCLLGQGVLPWSLIGPLGSRWPWLVGAAGKREVPLVNRFIFNKWLTVEVSAGFRWPKNKNKHILLTSQLPHFFLITFFFFFFFKCGFDLWSQHFCCFALPAVSLCSLQVYVTLHKRSSETKLKREKENAKLKKTSTFWFPLVRSVSKRFWEGFDFCFFLG